MTLQIQASFSKVNIHNFKCVTMETFTFRLKKTSDLYHLQKKRLIYKKKLKWKLKVGSDF